MTSRELVDEISNLVDLKIQLARGDVQGESRPLEEIELSKRRIADALKRLDHNPGVAASEKKPAADWNLR